MAELTDDTFKRMAMGKVFKDNTAAINSVDFSGDGEYLVTSSDDESIRLYSCAKGDKRKTSYSKKYGVGLVRFTHHSPAVICASKNKWDETLRYLSLHDNQYIRYFRGHRDKVVCMDMCPKDDTFLSASLDRTVRLWDLRSPVAKGLLNTKEIIRPCAKFDPSGLIFVAATKNKTLKLFDVRAYDKGPFATFNGIYDDDAEITAMDISADGKHLLVSTNQSTIYMIDAFDGSREVYFKGHTSTGPDTHATFSPDAKYVLSGSETGKIHVWEASTGRPVSTLEGHPQPTKQVRCNPTKMMLASACQTLAFWIPAPTGSR
jgi:COMPASS component SWD2